MSGENRKLGCFRLLDKVGKGSLGVVYKAVCERKDIEGVQVGTTVALTVIPTRIASKRIQACVAEIQKLAHPGIVKYFGCFAESNGSIGDDYVVVTEWLEGETLNDRLRRNPQGLDADETLRIGEQMLSALAYAASQGVAHRHIEPSNVFLCKDGVVKLIGFERACVDLSRLTFSSSDGPELAALDYLAPDFLDQNFHGDEQSDIFSVGVCLHEMLSGIRPYLPVLGEDRMSPVVFFNRWARAGESNGPIKISPMVNRLLEGARDVLAKALRPKREERYATFADFAAAFKGIRCRELTHGENTWRLLQYVGRGGFGEVFKARDVKTGQLVAIKRLMKSQYADRFKREASALSQLNDSSIVRFISFFEKEMGGCKHAFLVMAHLDGMPGKTLRDELRVAGGKPLSRELVLRAFARYAHGLSVMHDKGFVHRDIKPGKLYFPTDEIDRALIMSSSIVRDMSGTMTAGTVPGTLDYMPPEVVVAGSRGDVAMDIYALGLSLYEALSGKMAYPRLPSCVAGVRAFVERATNKTRHSLDASSYSDSPDLVRLVEEMTDPEVDRRLKEAVIVERRLLALLGASGGAQDRFPPRDLLPPDGQERNSQDGQEVSRSRDCVGVAPKMSAWWLSPMAAVWRLLFRKQEHNAKIISQMLSNEGIAVNDFTPTCTFGSDTADLVSEAEDGTDDPAAFLNLHGHATIHGFRLDREPFVAEGGQGRVFKAVCVEEGRLGLHAGDVVALKFVAETEQSPSFDRFEKAVSWLRVLESRHVAKYHGCFKVVRTVNGKLKRFRMTVMEYLDGADLAYRVKVRSPNFYADEIMYVLDQLLEGLCELAEAGVIHRDIKPSNIFICRDGTVKLIDFDTALIRGIDLCPKNRKIVGTPEFAAPDYLTEGFRGDEVSDVFSVGMTLYYMVHGVSPHRAIGTLDGRMDENIFRAFWFKRHEGSGSQGWWEWNKKDGCDSRSHAPLLGLQRLLDRCLTADRNCRYGGFKEFRLSLQKVGFRTVQYGGRLLRVVSGLRIEGGWGPAAFYYGEGRAADGELHSIPLEVLHKTGVWSLETGVWRKICTLMRRVFCKTEMFDSNSLAEMRKSFDKSKSLDEWHKEIEEENERAMYS